MIKCKKCKGQNYVKNGMARGFQKYRCKTCGCHFIEGDRRTNKKIQARKAACIILYSTGKVSINMIAKIFNMCWSLVYRWINESAQLMEDYEIGDDIKEIEFDEMWHFISKKKKTLDYQSF